MPKFEEHTKQIAINNSLLDENVFKDNDKYNDWEVTIIFYTAIHIVEKHLSSFDLHSGNHSNRNKNMCREAESKKILSDYLKIENQSRNSRYNCKQFRNDDIEKLKKSLNNISKVLG